MQQYNLFAIDEPGRLEVLVLDVVVAMNRAASQSGLSRDEIIDRMNKLASEAGVRLTAGKSKNISLAQLEKWLNPAENRPPSLLVLNAFCRAINSIEPLQVMLAIHGCELMTKEDARFRDYGFACYEAEEASKRKKMKRSLL